MFGFVVQGSTDNPATAVQIMLQDTRVGLGLPLSVIDQESILRAGVYYAEEVPHENTAGMEVMAPRYTCNGVLGTEASILDRINTILIGTGSSLVWKDGRFGIFVNREVTPESFTFDVDNIIGRVQVTESGFNNLINEIEIRYGRDERNNWERFTETVIFPVDQIPQTPVSYTHLTLPTILRV